MAQEAGGNLDVLFLLGAAQLRGSYARSLSLAQQLSGQNVRLKIVATEAPRELPQTLQTAEFWTSRYLHRKLTGTLARRCLVSDLKQNPPSLIDIQHRGLHPLGSWLARQLRRPYVVTVHDYLSDRERFVVDPHWCRKVVAVSDSVRSELLERTQMPDDLVTVIPSGVLPPPEKDLRCVLVNQNAPVIGTAGPLEAGKGLQHFLQAAVQILNSHPNAVFLIAGSGPEERSLRRLAADLGVAHAVSILPNLRDFNAALEAMDIFVLPALKQGLGTIMLDAMARGMPVIATESGGVFSVVVDGATGLLVPPSNSESLAEKVLFLIEHPDRARELGAAARERVINQFHLDQMIAATVEMYRQLIAVSKG